MTINKSATAILSAALMISGCGSIIHGTTQSIGFSSEPEGASVMVNGQSFGVTPAFAELARKEQHIVSISLPGYKTKSIPLTRSVSGWVWGNIVFGGLIGLVVDASSGGLYKLSPEQVVASLDNVSAARLDEVEDGIYIQIVLEPASDWVKVASLESIELQHLSDY